jgi:hypothetical protein
MLTTYALFVRTRELFVIVERPGQTWLSFAKGRSQLMTAIAVAVHLPDLDGMPADDTINTFHFADSGAETEPAALAANVFPLLEAFYNVASNNPDGAPGGGNIPAGNTVGSLLGSNLATACTMIAYQLAPVGSMVPVTPLGGPIATHLWNMTGPGGGTTNLPRECAVVLSLAAAHAGVAEDVPGGVPGPKGDTHPAARYRGRIYLGPLNLAAVTQAADSPVVNVSMQVAATGAAYALNEAVNVLAGDTSSWVVWSRKDHLLRSITGGWCDNAFDTQRRRGLKASSRMKF